MVYDPGLPPRALFAKSSRRGFILPRGTFVLTVILKLRVLELSVAACEKLRLMCALILRFSLDLEIAARENAERRAGHCSWPFDQYSLVTCSYRPNPNNNLTNVTIPNPSLEQFH